MNRLTITNKHKLLPKLPINMRTIPHNFAKTNIQTRINTLHIGTKTLLNPHSHGIHGMHTSAYHHFYRLNQIHNAQQYFARNVINTIQHPSLRSTKGVFKHITQQLQSTKSYYMLKYSAQVVNSQVKQRPLLAAAIMGGVKGLLADFIAQYAVERKSFNEIDWHRNQLFGLIGLTYTGVIIYGIYNKIYPTLFRPILQSRLHWLSKAVAQSTVDQFLHTALFYFPFFYAFKAGIYNGFSIENCSNGIKQYFTQNIFDDVKVSAALWIPVNIITFGLMPAHLKGPFTIAFSFAWYVVLSVLRGAKQDDSEIDNNDEISL